MGYRKGQGRDRTGMIKEEQDPHGSRREMRHSFCSFWIRVQSSTPWERTGLVSNKNHLELFV